MSYTKRTCHYCGWKDIQPNMRQKEIEYTSGSSNTGMNTRTLLSAIILGEKKSSNRLATWFFAPSKRNYKRRKKIWVCNKCK